MTIRWKAWLLNGLIAVTSLVVGLLLTEAGVRLISPQPTGLTHQDRYGLGMHWPSMKRYLPQFGHTVAFNSAGMRDREHSFDKPAGVFRILVLGDSFMEALQVDFEASFPSLLAEALEKQTGKRIEVINAGVSGWGTDDELRYLTYYGLRWNPDLVVVAMTLHNDVSDNLREQWHTLANGVLIEKPREPAPFLAYHFMQLKEYVATRFQTYQLWRKVRHGSAIRETGRQLNSHIVELFREPSTEPIKRGFALTERLLEKIQSTSSAAGSRLAIVLLPLRVQLSDSGFAEFVRDADATVSEMPIEKPQRLVGEMAIRLRIPKVDLLPEFRRWSVENGVALYLTNDGHWNKQGHRLAADVAARRLVEAGLFR